MASEYTEHFNLDLYTDNDRPNLRDQYNAAIRKIDNKLFDQVTTINLLDSVVDNLKEDVEQAQTDLSNEVTARTNADTALGTRIDNETTARESADQTLTTDLAAEVTAREGADTTLDNKIDAETTARTNADNALDDRITETSNAINAEVTAREQADAALNTRIDNMYSMGKWVIIGDSWSDENDPYAIAQLGEEGNWVTQLRRRIVGTDNVHNFAKGATGLVKSMDVYGEDGNSYPQQLQKAADDNSFKNESVRYIIVQGELNDYTSDVSLLKAAINQLSEIKKNNFPNAEMFYFGAGTTLQRWDKVVGVYDAICDYAASNAGDFLMGGFSDAFNVCHMFNQSLIVSSGTGAGGHLNKAGNLQLLRVVLHCIQTHDHNMHNKIILQGLPFVTNKAVGGGGDSQLFIEYSPHHIKASGGFAIADVERATGQYAGDWNVFANFNNKIYGSIEELSPYLSTRAHGSKIWNCTLYLATDGVQKWEDAATGGYAYFHDELKTPFIGPYMRIAPPLHDDANYDVNYRIIGAMTTAIPLPGNWYGTNEWFDCRYKAYEI